MRRRIFRAVVPVALVAALTPIVVLLGAKLGAQPGHYSGVALIDLSLPVDGLPAAAPGPAIDMLARAQRLAEANPEALGHPWYDRGRAMVVLAAANAQGEALARQSGPAMASGGVSWGVARVRYGFGALEHVKEAAIGSDDLPDSMAIVETYVDAPNDRVVAGVERLSNRLLSALADRFGRAIAVAYDPLRPATGPAQGSDVAIRSWWARKAPLASWFTLAVGFPWYLGGVLVAVAGGWLLPGLWRGYRDWRSAAVPATP